MKSTGRHKEKALSALQVRQLREPGRYTDGNGLYLVVDLSGAKRWLLRLVVQGRRRDIGLGGASLVSLAEARERAIAYRKIAREGGDPLAIKNEARKVVPTFKEAAERVHAEHEVSWKNRKHAQQWINTLKQYVYPYIGAYRVDSINTPDVLRALSPIWLTKPETARRVRQRIGTVMDWAKASGFRTGDNPVEGVARGLPKQGDSDKHHEALAIKKGGWDDWADENRALAKEAPQDDSFIILRVQKGPASAFLMTGKVGKSAKRLLRITGREGHIVDIRIKRAVKKATAPCSTPSSTTKSKLSPLRSKRKSAKA